MVMVIDSFKNEGYRLLLHENIAFALRWLHSGQTAQLPTGKYELRGQSLYAIVDEYMTRPQEACRLETHRRYIDVQYVVRGRELMGYAPVHTLEQGPYDQELDVQFHRGQADFFLLREGMFAVMLPGDAHMPCIVFGNQPETVRKIVVKVAVDMQE
jgi:biofilm protein TabA